MPNRGDVIIFETVDELNRALCRFIIDTATQAVLERNSFVIALSGGNTPNKMYALLAQAPYVNQMPWQNTFVFWGDERCVPLNDEQNNAYTATVEFLSKVPIPPSNIHPVPVNYPPAQAANSYQHTIQYVFSNQKPVFDLILLGLGNDGHTASLFPNTEILHETERMVKDVYVPVVGMHRVSFTLPLINMAANVVFMVAGYGKAEILNAVLNNTNEGTYPAQLVSPVNGKLLWYADKAAAKLLI